MILILIFDYFLLGKNCHRLGGNHETVSLCFGPLAPELYGFLKVPGSNTYCIQWHRRSQRMARNNFLKTVISHRINLHQIRDIKKYQNMGSVCDIYIYCIYIYILYIYILYIYIYIIVCKRSVHSMDCGQTSTVLAPTHPIQKWNNFWGDSTCLPSGNSTSWSCWKSPCFIRKSLN